MKMLPTISNTRDASINAVSKACPHLATNTPHEISRHDLRNVDESEMLYNVVYLVVHGSVVHTT